MARKEVTENQLVAIIKGELVKQEECAGCRVNGIVALREPDDEGCNWSEPCISFSGVPVDVCRTVAAQVVARARTNFNLKL